MKIIQSFAKYKDISPYIEGHPKPDYYYLNFYSMLLSYIKLQEYYGSVTMYCDEGAYDSIIKHIPYDEVVHYENDNDFIMWSKYKLDVMRLVNDDFIHVDQDVFIFNDFYKPFIDGECDVLVQDVISRRDNYTKSFVYTNIDYFINTQIITKPYDGQGFSCGSVGLNKKIQEYYFAGIDVLYNDMLKIGIENIPFAAMILEETLLYLITIENDFKYDFIIQQQDVMREGLVLAGDKMGYVHLWARNKFKKHLLNQTRNTILNDYPQYHQTLYDYEVKVMKNTELFKYMFDN